MLCVCFFLYQHFFRQFLFCFLAFTLHLQISYICVYIFTLLSPLIQIYLIHDGLTRLLNSIYSFFYYNSFPRHSCPSQRLYFMRNIFCIFHFFKTIYLYLLKYSLLLHLAFEMGFNFTVPFRASSFAACKFNSA